MSNSINSTPVWPSCHASPQPDRADGQSIKTKFRVLPLHAERLQSELDTALWGLTPQTHLKGGIPM